MKNLRTQLALSLAVALAVACSSKSTDDQSRMQSGEKPQMNEGATSEEGVPTVAIAFKEESTTQIFNAYLALKDALVATDGEKVSAEAKKLEALLKDGTYTSIKADVEKIASSTDPKVQRESFDSLSEQMITLAKNSELTAGTLFLQHCPMANENQGANWLSASEQILNPYFGDQMLTCGEVRETI